MPDRSARSRGAASAAGPDPTSAAGPDPDALLAALPAPDPAEVAALLRRLRAQVDGLQAQLAGLHAALPSPAADLAARIEARWPRIALLDGPTPLQPLPRLSAALGVELWVKRDDFGSLALAGAKARKLERVVEAARAAGRTTLLTAGPSKSNTSRAMAAACARAGLSARILLRDVPDAPVEANALLATMAGARIDRLGLAPSWPEVERLAAQAAAGDPSIELVPMGATSAAGVAGMAAGYLEMLAQADAVGLRPTAVWHASATGGIWAGLQLAAGAIGGPRPVPVAVVGDIYPDMPARYAAIHDDAADALGLPQRVAPADVPLDSSTLDAPYGEPSDAMLEAILLAMRTEGLLFDYVYTARPLAALAAAARAGRVRGPVVLWHSGGLPGVMSAAMQRALAAFAARG